MAFENGVNWQPLEPESRGRFRSFSDAVLAAAKSIYREQNPFFTQIADNWAKLFPTIKASPLRFENDILVLAVKNAPTLFMMRSRLAEIRRVISALPGAPAKFRVKLEIHSC